MADIIQPKPIGFLDDPEDRGPEAGVDGQFGVRVQDIPVFLRCGADSMHFSWVVGRLHPGGDPSEAQLVLLCPDCGHFNRQIRIAADCGKTFQWEAASRPEILPLVLSDGRQAIQTVHISIVEPWGCPFCRHWFALKDNKITRERAR